MNRYVKSTTASVLAAALSASAVPYVSYSETADAADALMTRDVWCANEDVNRWESEHFQFIWGKNGADSPKITQSFLEENAKNLEACWDVYMNGLSMEEPTQSVNMSLRDGNRYKVNFYISGTGLSPFTDDWAYMGYDSQGYAFMFCCVGAMQNSPNPSWVLPHEFGHVVTAHQLGWNENKYVQSWWEAIANWYREQFLYSDYYSSQWGNVSGVTDYFETYMKNLCFTPILGRDNYASWAFLQYITENPDGLPGYGSSFVKDLMQQGQRDEYPYAEIERISGADMKDTLGHYAKRLATLDLAHKKDYQARQNELLARGEWNWGEIFTLLENTSGRENFYTVPTERAPQQFGVNIVPLEVTGDTVSVTLEGLTKTAGADWRACIAVEQIDGTTRYSDLFSSGETMTMSFDSGRDSAAYLTVTATPDSSAWQQIGVPWAYGSGEFDETHSPFLGKTRYPWGATITGAAIKQSQDKSAASRGSRHANGGGFVAATANVDASAYVGPNAKVLGFATVSGNAVIDGHAVVTGNAKVSGNAVVTGHAVVAEDAVVKDNAVIADYAGVMGQAVISDNARVIESGLVFNKYTVSGNATVKGVAYCLSSGSASGQAMPDGDFYDDSGRSIQKGSVFGWASYDDYALNRPYTDGQLAALEFTADSSDIAADVYTSTFGIAMGAPSWGENVTSGKGVLTFDGSQYIIADSSYAALHDAEYQTAVLLRSNGRNEIFRFGSADKSISLAAENGSIKLSGINGESVAVENAYAPGEWATVSVLISGGKAELKINNGAETKTASGAFSAEPVDVISSDSSYLIGAGMNGSMDYFRVFGKDVEDAEYYYTEKENISSAPVTGFVGDLDSDGRVDSFDLVLMRKAVVGIGSLTDRKALAAADVNGDSSVNVADLVALSGYLLGREKSFDAGSTYII